MEEYEQWGRPEKGMGEVVFIGLGVLFLLFFILFFMYPHQDANEATRVIQAEGFTEPEILEEGGWFECGKGDFYKTPFQAVNSNGETVKGTVCCGWIAKGCTVRF